MFFRGQNPKIVLCIHMLCIKQGNWITIITVHIKAMYLQGAHVIQI